MRKRLTMMQQTSRDWQNVIETVRERPLDTLLGIGLAIGVAAFMAAPWLMSE